MIKKHFKPSLHLYSALITCDRTASWGSQVFSQMKGEHNWTVIIRPDSPTNYVTYRSCCQAAPFRKSSKLQNCHKKGWFNNWADKIRWRYVLRSVSDTWLLPAAPPSKGRSGHKAGRWGGPLSRAHLQSRGRIHLQASRLPAAAHGWPLTFRKLDQLCLVMPKGGSWWSVLSDWHFCCPVTAADASGRAGKGTSRQQEEDEQDGGLTQVRVAYVIWVHQIH